MKKILYFQILIILLFNLTFCHAQSFGEDSKGFSTLLIPTTNINLNVIEKQANFSFLYDWKFWKDSSYNVLKNEINLSKIINNKESGKSDHYKNDKLNKNFKTSKSLIFGFTTKGKSIDGFSSIISAGKLNSESEINPIIGYKFNIRKFKTNGIDSLIKAKNIYIGLLDTLEKIKAETIKTLIKGKVSLINEYTLKTLIDRVKEVTDKETFENLKNYWENDEAFRRVIYHNPSLHNDLSRFKEKYLLIIKGDSTKIKEVLSEISNDVDLSMMAARIDFNTELKFNKDSTNRIKNLKKIEDFLKIQETLKTCNCSILTSLFNFVDKKLVQVIIDLEKAKINRDREINSFKKNTSHLIYLRPSFAKTSFTYDSLKTSLNWEERFADSSIFRPKWEIGYNFQFSNKNIQRIGASITFGTQNNLSKLSPVTYNSEIVDTTSFPGRTIKKTESIEAISSGFLLFREASFNLDYALLFPLNKSKNEKSGLFASLNPYLRYVNFYDLKNKEFKLIPNTTTYGLGLHIFNAAKGSLMGGTYFEYNKNREDKKEIKSKTSISENINFGVIIRVNFSGFKAT